MVCDPFGGSGTVALVARETKRDFVCAEISPEYSEIARDLIGTKECPSCRSMNTIKWGIENRVKIPQQTYYCKDCGKRFSLRSKESDIIFQLRNTSPENIKKILQEQINK
jgi:Zn ribbon nucleic-acid-binding protein